MTLELILVALKKSHSLDSSFGSYKYLLPNVFAIYPEVVVTKCKPHGGAR